MHFHLTFGLFLTQCQLICHKKCLKKMTIMCPRAPLGPRCGVLNQDIESFPDTEMVPILVLKCTAEIERRAITRPGVYRLSGVASRVEKLLKSFESGPDLIDLSDVSCNDITSLLKVYLRNLKEPLVMNHIYKEYLDIGRVFRRDEDDSVVNDGIMTGNPERSELLRQIRTVIAKLTPHRLATMRHMMAHLKRVTSYHRQNNMTPSAMGIIFAPTIFRPREKVNDLFTEVFEAAPQSRVIELLIRHYEWIFEWRPDYSDLLEEFEPIRSEPIEGTEAGSSEQMPPSPPLSPSNAMSSDSNLFSNSNMTANIGASICGGYHQKCSSTRVSAAVRHSQVRRTSSSSSASPSPGASAMGGTGPCTGHHHKKASHTMAAGAQEASQHPHHCLSSSASTFTFD